MHACIQVQQEAAQAEEGLRLAKKSAAAQEAYLGVLQAEAAPTADAPSFANGGGHRRLEGAADEGADVVAGRSHEFSLFSQEAKAGFERDGALANAAASVPG